MKGKIIAAVVSFLFICSITSATMDYRLAVQEQAPMFALQTALYKDGGTSIYTGLGYTITDYNKIDGRQDVVFRTLFFSRSLGDKYLYKEQPVTDDANIQSSTIHSEVKDDAEKKRFALFLQNYNAGITDTLEITSQTEEGTTTFRVLQFNGRYVSMKVAEADSVSSYMCNRIEKAEEGNSVNYYLTDCSAADVQTVPVVSVFR